MITFKDFLLKYSSINKTFLEDFNEIINENYLNMTDEFVINSNNLLKWLNISSRKDFHDTIKRSYKLSIDYILKPISKNYKGGNNEKIYMLTPDCAKMILQSTKSEKGKEIRKYFIEIEKMLYKYKDIIIKSLQNENELLKNNQKPKIRTKEKTIYIFKALNTELTLHKLGRSKDLQQRLKQYNSGLANDVKVVYEYHTENIESVEDCLKALLREKKYRKYKEVFEVDLDIIKETIKICDESKKIINKKIIEKDKNNKLYMYVPIK